MHATIGDEVVIDTPHTGDRQRRGEILEILDHGGVVHYRVRWDDGHQSVYFPGSDAHLEHLDSSS